MPRYYPIYLDLAGKLCVVVGGGKVAERKVEGLREAGARVRVVSPELTPRLQAQADAQEIEVVRALFQSAHLTDAILVFAATDDRLVNAQVCRDAAARGLFVCVADAPDEGNFVVPSVVRRGELCVSISTGGNSPLLAAQLRAEMETRFGPEYAEFVELLGRLRDYIQERTPEPQRRRAALLRLVEHEAELRALLRAGDAPAADAQARALVAASLE